MISIQIWHRKFPTFQVPKELPDDLNVEYTKVSEMSFPDVEVRLALELAFERSQNTEVSWDIPHTRSTSVGDLMLVEIGTTGAYSSVVWCVAPTGFYSIEL